MYFARGVPHFEELPKPANMGGVKNNYENYVNRSRDEKYNLEN